MKLYLSDTWVPRDGLFDIRTISLPEAKALLSSFEVVNEISDADLSYRLVLHLGSVELPAPVTLDEMLFNLPANGLALMVDADPLSMVWRFELVRKFDRDEVLAAMSRMSNAVRGLVDDSLAGIALDDSVGLCHDAWLNVDAFAARLGGAL